MDRACINVIHIQNFLDKLSVLGAEDTHLLGDHVVTRLNNDYRLYFFDGSEMHLVTSACDINVLDPYKGYIAVGNYKDITSLTGNSGRQLMYYVYDTNKQKVLCDTEYSNVLTHNNDKFLVSMHGYYACVDKTGRVCSKFTTFLMSPINAVLNVFGFICIVHSRFETSVYDTVTDKIITIQAASMCYIDGACIMFGTLNNELGSLVLKDGYSLHDIRKIFVPNDNSEVINKATENGYYYKLIAKNPQNVMTDYPINVKNKPLVVAEGNFIRQEF